MSGFHDMDWDELQDAVFNAAPTLNPPDQYWLTSDAALSYCRKCAIEARGKEFELGPLIAESEYVFWRDEWEDAFFNGIECYVYGASPSDGIQSCETCGITLEYSLTDCGIGEEIDHWLNSEMGGDPSEISYNLGQLFSCRDDDKEDVRAIAIRFLEWVSGQPKSTGATQ